jgi:AraC-like DNA-binding protein
VPELLIRLFHISRATLYRLFEDEGGVAAYILSRRLDRCRAILGASTGRDPSISELAFNHGFVSVAHFSRAFRRRFGIAPRDGRGVDLTPSPAPRSTPKRVRSPIGSPPCGAIAFGLPLDKCEQCRHGKINVSSKRLRKRDITGPAAL